MRFFDKIKLKRLDWYLIKKFLGTYFFSIALIITIIIVFDYNENIDKFSTSNATMKEIFLDYYLNLVPYYANTFSALFVFISVIYFTSKLAENSEIIAIFASGVSFKRMLRPYLIAAAFIAGLTYCLGAYVIPNGTKKRLDFEVQHKRKKVEYMVQNIQIQVDENNIANFERFDKRTNTGVRFSLDRFEGKKLVSRLQAGTIKYNPDKKHTWTMSNWQVIEYADTNTDYRPRLRAARDTIIKFEPEDFLVVEGQQETMTSPELSKYIDQQRERGMSNLLPFEIEYHKRIAMTFAAFILTVIGVSLSSKKSKGGMGVSLGIGLALSFSYILFQAISSAFAESMPVIFAVWLPNIVYTGIAFYLYYKAPK